MTGLVRRMAVATAFGAALPSALRAQCPDGMPPPCARPAAPPAARVAMDENVVAIFPFRVSGSSADAGWLREGAADLMNLALDEQAGWRAVSQRSVLAAARTLTDATPEADFARAARGLGAGTMILGTAIVVGPQVRARVELHDVIRNRIVTSAERRGLLAEPAQIVDSLAADLARARLVAGVPGTRRRSLDEYTASPRALRAYLAAERLGRRGEWGAAAESLVVAIDHDSTFGLAYYRLGIAMSFGGDPAGRIPLDMPRRVRLLIDRLPRRQRDLVAASTAREDGDVRQALAHADMLGRTYPDDPEAAYEQGEAYFHLGLPTGEPPERALAAYERAGRLDSLFLDPWGHIAELRMMVGDGAGALAAAAHGRRVGPASPVHKATEMAMRAIVRRESPAALVAEADGERWHERTGYAVPERACVESLRALTNEPARALELCDQFLTAAAQPNRPAAERAGALAQRARVAAVRGRVAAAESLVAQARSANASRADLVSATAIAALLSGRRRDQARALLGSASTLQELALRGQLEVEDGDTAAFRITIAALLEPGRANAATRGAAAALEALAALRRGDSTAAFERLRGGDGFVGSAPSASFGVTSSIATQQKLNVELARIEASRGASEAALRRLADGTFANSLTYYRGEYEEVRATVLERMGDRAGARTAWRNVIGIWEQADAPWQPRVAAARAALARLDGTP